MKKILFCVITLFLLAGCKTKNVPLDETFFVNFAKAVKIKDTTITLNFFDVVDSRCPEDAACPGPGEAQVTFHVIQEGELQPLTFSFSTEPVTQVIDGFEYTLEQLSPIPNTQVPMNKKEYQAHLSVRRDYALEGTEWQLSAYGIQGEVLTDALPNVTASLWLDSNAQTATIETPCPTHSGTYSVDAPRILFSNIRSTLADCKSSSAEIEAQNNAYLDIISAATEFELNSYGLSITTDDGRTLMFAHPDMVLQQALTKNKKLWQKSGVNSYRYTFNRSCFCVPLTPNADVYVHNHLLLDVVDPETEKTIPAEELPYIKTVNQLFTLIEEAQDMGAAKIEVTFAEDYGYPQEVYIDYATNIADDEFGYRITDFKPLE